MFKRSFEEFEQKTENNSEAIVVFRGETTVSNENELHSPPREPHSTSTSFSEISQPATKLVKIDDEEILKHEVLDKCIQVNSFVGENFHTEQELEFSEKEKCAEEVIESAINNNDELTYEKNCDLNCDDDSQTLLEYSVDQSLNTDADDTSFNDSDRFIERNDSPPKAFDEYQNSIVDETENEIEANQNLPDNAISAECQSSDKVEVNSSTATSFHSLLKVPGRKPKIKKKVTFNGVTVYYFKRSQGFTCIPSQGGSTLGMENTHSYFRSFTLETHAEERKQVHKELLLRRKRFVKMNKNLSTSESEDESLDDLSDLSEVDSDNENCYFLQPVPIKQRRALLRASGVRKIETAEKEECRDIRISREFCGCDCRIFCNPRVCLCSQAGIKCQVDRMSFPCGCTREGCANSNGRIEFNPLRVQSHFIHTVLRLEMEKKQPQDLGNHPHHSYANTLTSEAASSSSSSTYTQSINGCNPNCIESSQSSNVYLPTMQHMPQYVTDSSYGMFMPDVNSSYVNTNNISNIYNNEDDDDEEYSPDNCSYSESSEYTTDDFDEEYNNEVESQNESNKVIYSDHQQHHHHQTDFIIRPMQEDMHIDVNSTRAGTLANTSSHSASDMNLLPPIRCDLPNDEHVYSKENHSPVYENSIIHFDHSSSYQSYDQQSTSNDVSQQSSQHSDMYMSYGMHQTTPHYSHYEFNKNSHTFHQNESTNDSPPTSVTNLDECRVNNQQQYIDLSLSIASSSAKSMLSAANKSGDESHLTLVSFQNHIPPISPNSFELQQIEHASNNLCSQNTFDEQSFNLQQKNIDTLHHGSNEGESSQEEKNGETVNITSDSSSSDNDLFSNDNFGEIIKKTIVESVSA